MGAPKLPLQPDEIKFLKDNFFKLTNSELTEHINKLRSKKNQFTVSGVVHKCRKLGLSRGRQIRWSKTDENRLKAWYKIMGDKQISELLNEFGTSFKIIDGEKIKRSFNKKNVEKKRTLLGLTRTKTEVSNIIKDNQICREYNFFSATDNLYTRGQRTRAKEEEIRIWKGRKWIKINGKFIPYTRWFYHNFINEVPEEMIVFHIDMDPLNDEPFNLTLRERKGYTDNDFISAKILLEERLSKLRKESELRWEFLLPDRRKELMAEMRRIQNIIDRINKKKQKNPKGKEQKLYVPMEAF